MESAAYRRRPPCEAFDEAFQETRTLTEIKHSMPAKNVRWWVVLLAGLGVALSTYLLQQLIIYLYVFGPRFVESSVFGHLLPAWEPWEVEQAQRFGDIVGLYVMPALHLVLVFAAASWVGRRLGTGAASHGILISVAAVAANQAIGLLYGPLVPRELAIYLVLGLAGGIAGGLRGWNVRSGEEALHEVSRAVGAASSPDEIATAVGERLAGSRVGGVSLWRYVEDEESRDLELAGWWRAPTSTLRIPELRAGVMWELEAERTPRRLAPAELPEQDRDAWRRQGIRSALVVPLVSAQETRIGVMMVTSRKRSGFSAAERKAYSTAAAGAALALENLRLVEEARQAATVRERQRMAHEIHDTLAQGFTSIVMNAQAAEGVAGRDSDSLQRHLGQIESTARESLTEARRLVWALRPERLAESSPGEALGELAESWSRQSGVEAGVEVVGKAVSLSTEAEATLLRTAQESLSNARKHAGASRVGITLSYMAERVLLDIRDDGAGFDPDTVGRTSSETNGQSGGFGLEGMRERAEKAGGKLTVESAPGEGTTVALDLPADGGPANSEDSEGQQRHSGITGKAR